MASLIEGYEYDIFISYRQKDNKHDGWVTKFMDNLKGELEATFKEDVSVYFDENPHERLQETHNVDKSLEGKLKCLIFIPILSQTYCDPNSYAWQYEFLAFLRMAENDRFGKDVKLRNGNVTSRILPIRIHDLEQEDIKLFEKETGSVLRAMDFVFKTSTGVNRPLKADEDHPQDNLNKIYYSDQINKVANSIKEIILGLKTEPVTPVKEKIQQKVPSEQVSIEEKSVGQGKPLRKLYKRKLLSGIAIIAVLIIAGIFVYPKIFQQDRLEYLSSKGKISIAVMPFQNRTSDAMWNDWQNGIQDILITYLSSSDELLVRQTESINSLIDANNLTNYAAITPSIASNISKKLDANVFIYGSINQAGKRVRLIAQLIDSKTKEVIKPFQIEGPASEEYIFNIIDSLSVLVKNFLIITVLDKDVPPDHMHLASTTSPKAYRLFINGNAAFNSGDMSTASSMLSQAISEDSTFVFAKIFLCFSLRNQSLYEEAKKLCLQVYRTLSQMNTQQRLWTNYIHAILFDDIYEVIKSLRQLESYDNQNPLTYSNLGGNYNTLQEYYKAIPEFEKALDLYKKWGSKPINAGVYNGLGYSYHQTGQYRKEKRVYKEAEKDFPDNRTLIQRQAILALSEGRTKSAEEYVEKYKSILRDNSSTEADIAANLAGIYSEADILNKAEEYYREALSLQHNGGRFNTLAYFLIDNDHNINEGMQLVDTALKLGPDNYNFLHTKGWGLYKQGKYQEAKDMLQKSWDLRMKNAIYNHPAFLHLEAAKKAVDRQK